MMPSEKASAVEAAYKNLTFSRIFGEWSQYLASEAEKQF